MDTEIQSNALVGAVYTLTNTHCGTGQTAGAVDLPIARESHTRLPVLPPTMLKGVARQVFQREDGVSSRDVTELFGPPTDAVQLAAGSLVFTEGRLLALPVRSLNRPYLYCTCPLILQRLERDFRAFEVEGFFGNDWSQPQPNLDQAQVADRSLARNTLVVEDLVYRASEVAHLPQLENLATRMAALLPDNETSTRERLKRDLVVLPDNDLLDLAQRTPPVQARIQLGDGKTPSAYLNDDGERKSGNLWYEEMLPPDCLLTFLVVARPDARVSAAGRRQPSDVERQPLEKFARNMQGNWQVQIGGNETVGQGRCWWTFSDSLQWKISSETA